MARLRKDKGKKLQTGSITTAQNAKASSSSTSGKGAKKADKVLKDQIKALGGTEDDFDLVKDIDENAAASSLTVDPGLSKDVSKFLKNLNFDVPEDIQDEPIQEAGKRPEGKKSKKARAQKADPATTAPPKKTEAPTGNGTAKAEVPTKITFNSKSKFVFPPTAQWYAAIPPLKTTSSPLSIVNPAELSSLSSRAAKLHAEDTETFKSSSAGSSASETAFLSKIIQSGTLSDRLSALTLLVQSSPVHNTRALETLKGMAERGKGQGGREESLKALRCIVDWWVGGGAPNRKLKYFRDQPLTHPSVTDQHLLLWYFEDWLKKYFFTVLQILESLSLDPLPYVRTQALNLISTLLRDKPEQEQNLLRLLVNKLGDTDKSLCSKASHHILQLLQPHKSMKGVVVREIIALILKPPTPTAAATVSAAAAFTASTSALPSDIAKRRIRFSDTADTPISSGKGKEKAPANEKKPINTHARYYATITFNQIVLTPDDRDVALKLIEVYFELFRELLGEGKVSDEEDAEGDDMEKGKDGNEVKKDKKGRVFENRKGKKGKSKATEVKGAAGFAEVEDEHSKLISAILTGVNRALPFAKIDVSDVGLMKHIDTLFLITHKSTFNISLQALVLIQQVAASLSSAASSSSSKISKSIIDRYYRSLYTSLHDERLASSSKQAMYLNLLFKSLKADSGQGDSERIKALVKRFIQVLVSGGNGATEFVAGGLYLLGELFSTVPGLRNMLNESAKSDGESYDPRKRDPQYAHASSSPLWELMPLLHHYHPTISLHARQLLLSQPLTASADLSLNTLSHFLDRFVYKNPKKISPDAAGANGMGKGKGASAMQPAASGIEGVKLMKGEVVNNFEGLMNEEQFMKKRVEDVPVDQLFFHKFFKQKNEREKAKIAKADKHKEDGSDSENLDSDADDNDEEGSGDEEMDLTGDEAEKAAEKGKELDGDEDDSDADEAEIWKAMKASMPKDGGDDDLMDDLDDDDDSDLPSDFDDDDVDAESDLEEDNNDSDENLSLVEGSDNEDLISLNSDVPEGLIEYDGSDIDDEEEEWGGIEEGNNKKRKRGNEARKTRKKLRSLPTFASYEDYAKMIEDGPEDDI